MIGRCMSTLGALASEANTAQKICPRFSAAPCYEFACHGSALSDARLSMSDLLHNLNLGTHIHTHRYIYIHIKCFFRLQMIYGLYI